LLFSLLAGDMAALEKTFVVEPVVQGADWRASLTPKDDGLKRVIAGIAMSGGRFVSRVEIREAGGDRTEIRFSELVTGPTALTPADQKQFESLDGSGAR
jgi:hypothetical protein